jgi:LysR family nitrogen assimilation transcriptional regulator
MDLRRLKYFVRIVEIGSLTRAADILHIAQPALSQQLAALEAEFGQQLLVRSKRGVTPTEAGNILYGHAQIMLRQMEQAYGDVRNCEKALSGHVSVGLAPGTIASTLALPLLKTIRARHPGIILYINENFGTTLSELIMNGRMDMAVLYGDQQVRGLVFQPLLKEELYLVGPRGTQVSGAQIALPQLRDVELLLPRPYNYVRKLVDAAFARIDAVPRVVAEIESLATLTAAVADGFGATILPISAARAVTESSGCVLCRIVSPTIEAPLALCISDHLPLSDPAIAVNRVLLELVGDLAHGVGLPFALEA